MSKGAEEIEWHLDAVDLRPVRRVLGERGERAEPALEAAGTSDHVDTYLDTEDWRLHRAGFSLRIRAALGTLEATLKAQREATEGLRERLELSEPLDDDDPQALIRLRGTLGERLRSLVGTRPLRVLFEIATKRQTFTIRLGGDPLGELSLDDTTIPVDDGAQAPVRMQRVEIEAEDRDALGRLEPFVAELKVACGLRDGVTTKFQAGLLARGLVPPVSSDVGGWEIGTDPTVGDVAFATLRRNVTAFLEQEPGARLGEDPEAVHDMRVASRRMRAAMALFSEALPARFASFRRELKWVAGALGAVRDLDVQLAQVHEWTKDMNPDDVRSLGPMMMLLERRRRQARGRLLRTLDSRRYSRLTSGLRDGLRHGPSRRSTAARIPVTAVAPDLLQRRYKKVRRAGARLDSWSSPEDFHALRIRCKRLRYALEFHSEVYPGVTQPVIRRLVAVQDVLGEHQDAQVALGHLFELVEQRSQSFPPRAMFVLGRITERYERRASELRERFPDAFADIRGKPWKNLRREMRRRRPHQPEPAADAGEQEPSDP